jgi:hypothetical protein
LLEVNQIREKSNAGKDMKTVMRQVREDVICFLVTNEFQ